MFARGLSLLLMSLIDWAKKNKFASFLLLVIGFYFFKNFLGAFFGLTFSRGHSPLPILDSSYSNSTGLKQEIGLSLPLSQEFYREPAPAPEVKNRLVISESHLSLLVKDVRETLNNIKAQTLKFEGYLVNSSLSRPEEGASAVITLRLPQNRFDEALNYFRSQSVKVVSENLKGTDITDQFVDNQARLTILERNKARFEEIMKSAVKIEEILRVQQEIFNLQSQIDSIKGRQNYLEKSSQMAKITLYLSTDELALPYAPAESWRPEVIFKQAVRSLVSQLQNLGSLAIWFGVYAVIWLPILLVVLYLRRRKKPAG